ncbi:hypothetical protein DY000_02011240 [Brassica cretica]|uniref:Uncharacterized protein n=1 Tax=Brassica cretica TaxID=69181 RepID=A0ABQ7D716_BRACR|nr:hypothetical protein DY000_02011240 [Brassica cretica]
MESCLKCIWKTWRARHSEALSDGVRCGLSLVAFELALCVVELAILCSSCELCVCLGDQVFWCYWCALDADVLGEVLPRSGRLKPRLRGSLAMAVSLKRSVKIAAVEDSGLR